MAGSWWQISSPALCVSVAGWGWGRRCLLPCPLVPALPDPWQVELCQRICRLWCICISQCFGVESLSESLLLFLFHPWACNDRRDETWRNTFTDAKKEIRSPGPFPQGYFCPILGTGLLEWLLNCWYAAGMLNAAREKYCSVSTVTFLLDSYWTRNELCH